jgi:hypothetical protein
VLAEINEGEPPGERRGRLFQAVAGVKCSSPVVEHVDDSSVAVVDEENGHDRGFSGRPDVETGAPRGRHRDFLAHALVLASETRNLREKRAPGR